MTCPVISQVQFHITSILHIKKYRDNSAMKKTPGSLILICTLLLPSAFATAEETTPLNFARALELALLNDQDLQSAEFFYQSTLSGREQSRAALLPQITATLYTQTTEQETANSSNPSIIANGTIDYDTDGYNINLSQSLYNHGNYKTLQQTKLNIAAATANVEAARQSMIVRLAETYFNVLGAEDNLKFAIAEKEAISNQLEQAKRRFEVGLIAVTDVKESQASYDTAVAQEIDARNTLSATLESLAVILGEHHKKLSPMQADIPLLTPEPADIIAWTDSAKLNSPVYKAAQYNFQAAQKQVAADHSDHYPYLDLYARRSYSDPDGSTFITSESTDTTITLQLTVPIYSGGATSARHKQSVALKEQARAEKEKALRQTLQQTRDAYLGVSSSIAQVKAFKQALASTQIAHEATQAGFEAGTRTAIDVLTALREVYRAERDYARARYTYVINTLRLKQATGILSVEDAQKINQFLK